MQGWRTKQRDRTIVLENNKQYTPGDVSAILNCSHATALNRMAKMSGVQDIGVHRSRFQRTRRMLRISGRNLRAWLDGKKL